VRLVKPDWFDPIFILRPTLFFPSWTFFLAGFARGKGRYEAIYILWLGAALGASFLINQLTDRKEDEANGKLLPLWNRHVSNRFVIGEVVALAVVVLAGCIWAGVEVSGLLALFFLNAGLLYNFPPFRLKGRPVLGIISCAVGIWNGYLIGARASGVEWQFAALGGVPYAFAGAAVSILTSVPDLTGDIKTGVRTFAAHFGLRTTGFWAMMLVLISLFTSFVLKDYYLLSAAVISLPLFIWFYSSGLEKAADLATKIAIFSLAIAVGTTWLPFLAMIAFYYPFARWYHRNRLGLEYPTFNASKTRSIRPKVPINPLNNFSALEN
jgi:4-hydroxybenzoate polyprenyltransferase